MSARLDVLTAGYVGGRVASTVVLLRDQDLIAVVDPGMVADRARILEPLAALGVQPEQVTDVIFSHHHPDHTVNAALLRQARIHDFWATYVDDLWDCSARRDRPCWTSSPCRSSLDTGQRSSPTPRRRVDGPPVSRPAAQPLTTSRSEPTRWGCLRSSP